MSIDYSTIVGYGHMLGDAEVAALVGAGLAELYGDSLASGALFESLPGLRERWPNLRFEQSFDQMCGSIDAKVLVLAASTALNIDMKSNPEAVPARIRTPDSSEQTALTEVATLVGLQEEPGFYVGGAVF